MQDGWLLLAAFGVAWLGFRSERRLFNAVYTLRAAALTPMCRAACPCGSSAASTTTPFFSADGAAAHWAERRKKALDRLATYFQTKYAKSADWGNDIRESFSDLRFTDANRVPFPYAEVMRRKHDDHGASHSNAINQLFHILSSSVFIYCYFLMFSDLTTAMGLGLAALFVRQFGHAVLEPPCHDKEEILLGFNTHKKSVIVGAYLLIPVVHLLQAGSLSWTAFAPRLDLVAQQ